MGTGDGPPPPHRRAFACPRRLRHGRCRLGRAARADGAERRLGEPADPRRHGGRTDGSEERRLLPGRRPPDGPGSRESRFRPQDAARAAGAGAGAGRPDRSRRRGLDPADDGDTTTTVPSTTTTTTTAAAAAAPKQLANPDKAVTMAQLDARLVAVLGPRARPPRPSRRAPRPQASKVPSRFGTEVVARLLGLRLNHPASADALELLPNDPATRAEAAYSVAQMLNFDGWEVQGILQLADAFVLPGAQRPADADPRHRGRAHRHALHLGRHERGPRRSSASRPAAATTAPASSGASTSSRPTRTRAASRRPSAAARPSR